jgi:peptidyl-prolyl cis-trans isomerase B (cyclophilin B)
MLKIETTMGDITVELYEEDAPITARNFLKYLEDGHYNGTIFHRVIDGFMIQGGGFDEFFRNLPTISPIKNEAANGRKNKRGTLAMARTSDVHSATAQFFINTVDNNFLDYKDDSPAGFGYCVFGEVTEGTNVIDKIQKVQTGTRGHHRDVPEQNIKIISISK